jgi:hypothetical protein
VADLRVLDIGFADGQLALAGACASAVDTDPSRLAAACQRFDGMSVQVRLRKASAYAAFERESSVL